MDKQPVGQLPDLTQSNNDDEIMVITNSEYNQLKKEKIADFITDLTSTDENNAIVKGTDGKMFVTDFGNASNITEGTLPVEVLPNIPKDKLPEIETDDLPDSGITAGTYTYPTDIVVNSKGQVTSITEGQAGANNANQDLSNLGPLGLDKLNQSKALETGSVSSDADVYADVLKYKNSGTGTGIDVIKPDNFEVVGTPTISDDGIASGLDNTNYLTTTLNLSGEVIIKGSFKPNGANPSGPAFIMQIQDKEGNATEGVNLYQYSHGSFEFNYRHNNTSYYNVGQFHSNTEFNYTIIINSTSMQYIVYQNTNEIFNKTMTSNIPVLNGEFFSKIGHNNLVQGSVDLNSVQILNNGNLIYQPCLKIPYTLSKTGSKIVDAAYRDRVQDMYEQYGYAPYYTIDEENENFSLPMGEIYGMIERKNEELNNPFSLFDSKYSDAPLYNASWLLSNGTYYSKSVYVTAYEALVVENNSETAAGTSVTLPSGTTYVKRGLSVKLSTAEDITDYDFVINTTNETFRLPLLNGSEINIDYSQGVPITSGYIAPCNGVVSGGNNSLRDNSAVLRINDEIVAYAWGGGVTQDGTNIYVKVSKGDEITFTNLNTVEDSIKNPVTFFPAAGNGLLYFYVGETVQNANLINAGRIAEQINLRGAVVESYKNGTSWYRVWSDGWCEQGGYNSNTGTYTVTMMKEFKDTNYTLLTQYAETTNADNQVTPNELSTWNKTTSSFTTYSDFAGKIWLAFGYVA